MTPILISFFLFIFICLHIPLGEIISLEVVWKQWSVQNLSSLTTPDIDGVCFILKLVS